MFSQSSLGHADGLPSQNQNESGSPRGSTMSFLASDNESATLAAALAFIDAAFDATDASVPEPATADSSSSSCDGTGVEHAFITASSSCDSPSSSSSNSSRYNSDKLQDVTSNRGGDQSKQPKRSNAPAAMRLRRKRKAERIQLREQVAALEEQLKLLQQRQAHGVDRASDPTTSRSLATAEMLSRRLGKSSQAAWPAVASRIQQEPHRAELLNIQLKEILSKQVKLARSLKGAFQKRGVFQGIDIVFQPPAPSRGLSFSPSVDHNAVLSKMEMVVRDMYSATDSVLDSSLLSSIAESVFSSSAVKHDEGNGAYVEVATATPLACTYDQALQIIQGGLKLKDTLTNKQLIHNREENDRFAEKTYMVMLQDDHNAVSLRGAYLMRKFEAKHHTAYICASTARPPSATGVEFCERGWMVLSPSLLDPSCRTILRTCYQVSVDTGDITSLAAKIDDVGYLERFVLHSLSKKMRTMLQTMQNSLLDEVERVGGIPSTIVAF